MLTYQPIISARRRTMRASGPRTQVTAWPDEEHCSCFFATVVVQLTRIHYPLLVLS